MTSTDVDKTPVQGSMEDWFFRVEGILSKDQAREVTAKIKGYAGQLYRHVLRAHERRIWLSFGYSSWAEYCDRELGVSRSRGYQIVDWGLVDRALTAGEEPDAPAPVEVIDQLNEAQARPLAPFKHDRRAIRLIWARAQELAGPNASVTQGDVQAAVDEWLTPDESDLWLSADRLVTGVLWVDGPVWWFWNTPADGVVLHVGLGEFPGTDVADASNTWFVSEPRYGDFTAIACLDLDTLIPRLIAELFARQVPAPAEVNVVARMYELAVAEPGRGPYSLDRAVVQQAFEEFAQLADDDGGWRDTAPLEPVDPDDEVVDAEIIDDEKNADPRPVSPQGPAGSVPSPSSPAPQGTGSSSGTHSPGGDGEAASDEVVDSSPPRPRPLVTPADLAKLDDGDLVVKTWDALRCGLDDQATPDDCRFTAAWMRAVASRLESRAVALEREEGSAA